MPQPSENSSIDKIEKIPLKNEALSQDEFACKIVITCSNPNKDGKMEVEMDCEGDPDLAAFLLESASNYLDQQSEES